MEEEQAAYQSEPETTESTETTIESGGDVTQDPVTTQDEFDVIKYNKEEIKIPVSERQAYLQKGYNYDKVQQRAQELENRAKELEAKTSYLEKQARIYGYASVDEYMQAVDEFEKNEQIKQDAQRMGVDPETYAQYFAPVNQELSQLKQQLQTYEQQQSEQQRQQQLQKDWGSLYEAYPALSESSQAFNEGKAPEWFTPEMQELVGMGYKPVHAYELANKEAIFRQKEQEVLARVTGRDGKQVLSSTDQPNNMQFDPANMSDAEIQAISERVRRGERITLT